MSINVFNKITEFLEKRKKLAITSGVVYFLFFLYKNYKEHKSNSKLSSLQNLSHPTYYDKENSLNKVISNVSYSLILDLSDEDNDNEESNKGDSKIYGQVVIEFEFTSSKSHSSSKSNSNINAYVETTTSSSSFSFDDVSLIKRSFYLDFHGSDVTSVVVNNKKTNEFCYYKTKGCLKFTNVREKDLLSELNNNSNSNSNNKNNSNKCLFKKRNVITISFTSNINKEAYYIMNSFKNENRKNCEWIIKEKFVDYLFPCFLSNYNKRISCSIKLHNRNSRNVNTNNTNTNSIIFIKNNNISNDYYTIYNSNYSSNKTTKESKYLGRLDKLILVKLDRRLIHSIKSKKIASLEILESIENKNTFDNDNDKDKSSISLNFLYYTNNSAISNRSSNTNNNNTNAIENNNILNFFNDNTLLIDDFLNLSHHAIIYFNSTFGNYYNISNEIDFLVMDLNSVIKENDYICNVSNGINQVNEVCNFSYYVGNGLIIIDESVFTNRKNVIDNMNFISFSAYLISKLWFDNLFLPEEAKHSYLIEALNTYFSQQCLKQILSLSKQQQQTQLRIPINKDLLQSIEFKTESLQETLITPEFHNLLLEKERLNSLLKDLSYNKRACLLDNSTDEECFFLNNDITIYSKSYFLIREILDCDNRENFETNVKLLLNNLLTYNINNINNNNENYLYLNNDTLKSLVYKKNLKNELNNNNMHSNSSINIVINDSNNNNNKNNNSNKTNNIANSLDNSSDEDLDDIVNRLSKENTVNEHFENEGVGVLKLKEINNIDLKEIKSNVGSWKYKKTGKILVDRISEIVKLKEELKNKENKDNDNSKIKDSNNSVNSNIIDNFNIIYEETQMCSYLYKIDSLDALLITKDNFIYKAKLKLALSFSYIDDSYKTSKDNIDDDVNIIMKQEYPIIYDLNRNKNNEIRVLVFNIIQTPILVSVNNAFSSEALNNNNNNIKNNINNSTVDKNSIEYVVLDPHNDHYIFNYYDYQTLRYLVNEIKLLQNLFVNENKEDTPYLTSYINVDVLSIKVINELFLLLKLKILDSLTFTQFTRRVLVEWYENTSLNPIVINHYLSLFHHTITNYIFDFENDFAKKILYRIITEHYYFQASLSSIKDLLIHYLIDIININNSDQVRFLYFVLFKKDYDDDDSNSQALSSINIYRQHQDEVNNQNRNDDNNNDDRQLGYLSESTNNITTKLQVFDKDLIIKIVKKIFESTIITTYEKQQLEIALNNTTFCSFAYIHCALPNEEIKQRLQEDFLYRIGNYENLDNNNISTNADNINNEYSKNYLRGLLMQGFNCKSQYTKCMKKFYKKEFFTSVYHLLENHNEEYSYFYYKYLNGVDFVSSRNLENYIELNQKIKENIGYIDFLVDAESDLTRLKERVFLSEFHDSIPNHIDY